MHMYRFPWFQSVDPANCKIHDWTKPYQLRGPAQPRNLPQNIPIAHCDNLGRTRSALNE